MDRFDRMFQEARRDKYVARVHANRMRLASYGLTEEQVLIYRARVDGIQERLVRLQARRSK